jgi:hypothetical protein
MPPTIDILIRSYYRDLQWLVLAVAAIRCFVSGYRDLIVVLPDTSVGRIDWPAVPILRDAVIRRCHDYENDYIGQQITKLYADTYSDAEVILHLDSDHVFVAPCDLQDQLFEAGKLRMEFDSSERRPLADGWRRCPAVFLGRAVPLDVTGSPPVAFPRHLYSEVRRFCEQTHGLSIQDYTSTTRSDRFSEFAVLRGYALVSEPGLYAWVDTSTHGFIPACRRFWSRAQTPGSVRRELPEALWSMLPSTNASRV